MPCRSIALNRPVQVGASEMHQAFRYEADLHNSICYTGSRDMYYRFKGYLERYTRTAGGAI